MDMEEAHCTTDLYWTHHAVLLVFNATFGISFAWYLEWLRKAKEYNEEKNWLWTIKNYIEAALLSPRNRSTTPSAEPATQTAGRCLPSYLAQILKRRHGTRTFDCNISQCRDEFHKDEGLRASYEDANTSQADRNDITSDTSAPPTEIDEVKQYLANSIDTRSLIQRRDSRKRAEDAEAALHKERGEHEATKVQLKSTTSELVSTKSLLDIAKSEHKLTKVELTYTKTQLADEEMALDNANKTIESFGNQAHVTTPANPLQQENNELSEANDASGATIAQLGQEACKVKQRVAEPKGGKTLSLHSADAKTRKVEENKERSDARSGQANPNIGSVNGRLDTLPLADQRKSFASGITKTSSEPTTPVPATTTTLATNIEQSLGKVPSKISPRELLATAMPSKTLGSLSRLESHLLERSTSLSPLTPTPGEEGVSPDMTE